MNDLRVFVGLEGKYYHLTLESNGELLALPPATVENITNTTEKLIKIMISFINETLTIFPKNTRLIFYINDFDTFLDWKIINGKEKEKFEIKAKGSWDELIKLQKKRNFKIVNNYMSEIGNYYEQ